MNERIKEIALKCYSPYTNFDHQKFAELIVEECIDILSDEKTVNMCVHTTFDQSMARCVTENSIEKICEHFNMTRIYGVPHEGIMGRKIQTK